MRFHHVQLAMPRGGEEDARRFYAQVLGLEEIAKPPELAKRGGCWFRFGEEELHLGVEDPFIPARKAHPALVVGDLAELETALMAAGHEVVPDDLLPRTRRIYTNDPFGNRIELIQAGT
jgi:catechol 2,3-dioxygenase-like lactoylglutathione lyase family enzyme